MKQTNIFIIILFFILLGVGGYFFYNAYTSINNDEAFEFTPSEITVSDLQTISELSDSESDIDTEMEALEALDFESSTETTQTTEQEITEENFESTIESNQDTESNIDTEISELESLDF